MKKNSKPLAQNPGKFSRCAAAVFALLSGAELAQAEIAQAPLFLAQQLKPNIMFTLDDSGSMSWNCAPDSICPKHRRYKELPGPFDFEDAVGKNKYVIRYTVKYTDGTSKAVEEKGRNDYSDVQIAQWRSTFFNGMAYDPAVRYLPWQKADGSYWPAADPNGAWRDPRNENLGKVNLLDDTNANKDEFGNVIKYLSFYYVYDTKFAGQTATIGHFNRVDIVPNKTYPRAQYRDDCDPLSCTFEQESKNFANWFSYYQTRLFTAIAGTSQAFNPLLGNQRVGYGQINTDNVDIDGVKGNVVSLGVRDFSGAARTAFYTKLFAAQPWGEHGTPLHRAIDEVGRYFSRKDELGPWAEVPGVKKGIEYSCRKTYHILMTDGYWNKNVKFDYTAAASNADNTDGLEITNPKTKQKYQYKAASAGSYYQSADADTLADFAMYYWKTDLRDDLENNVPISSTNPAFWQHITQFTVGLGVAGVWSYPADEADLISGAKKWPTPVKEQPSAVDDLWHAAVNGRGTYFNAKNSKAFRDGLTQALENIAKQQAAASTVALNFSFSNGDNPKAFIPSFESGSWTGRLRARAVVDGVVSTTDLWKAEDLIPAWDSRNIVTWDKGNKKAVEFLWGNLSADQKISLGNESIFEYVRGNDAKERRRVGGIYRDRESKLGDIVNSSPLFVHQSNGAYNFLPSSAPEKAKYGAFYANKAKRTPMLYVGANDGMLHAFNANTGVEAFAYVPNSVYPKLKDLTDTAYSHRYYVDGQLIEGDAYRTSDGTWRTLVIGSTGAGAKSIFALDVSDPVPNGDKDKAAKAVLWEKDNSSFDTPDLGHQLGKAAVVKMRNGSWAVIVGNGYDSANKKSVLYILDAFSGNVIKAIDTGVTGTGINGLSTPGLLFNEKRELIAAYAGDLNGNLWKFDLKANDPANWKVDFAGAPLFVAKDKDGKKQSIAIKPALAYHPDGGYMVNIVTGKYFETNDASSTQMETVYGLWDKSDIENVVASVVSGARESILQAQTLSANDATKAIGGANLTTTEVKWSEKRGWFVDLSLGSGERGVGEPFITDSTTLWITTLDPVSDPCSSGGVSRLMGFDFLSGGSSKVPLFDTNGDNTVDEKDVNVSVVQTGGTVASSSSYTVPAACGGTGQRACPVTPTKTPACEGSNRKVLINRLDGTTQDMTIARRCVAPLRVWHELAVPY